MRLPHALKADVLFQARHGFYYLYLFIASAYILITTWLPTPIKAHILPELLFIEVTLLGYFFIGGIVLLERDQKLLECLFVTPLSITEYILSKTLSLAGLSLAVGFAITAVASGFAFDPLLLLAGIAFGSVFFTLIGMALASRVKNLNNYILLSLAVITIGIFPLFAAMLSFSHPLLQLLPGTGIVLLLRGALSGLDALEIALSLVSSLVFAVAAFALARKSLQSYMTKTIGGAA